MMNKICKIEDCERALWANGWCCMHNKRNWRNGNPLVQKCAPNGTRKYHPLYATYCLMKQRCYSPRTKFFKDYGGREIKVCDRWLGVAGFDNFVKDMGEQPIGATLDRIDNEGNYEADNCRWASKTIQAINRRKRKDNSSGHTGVGRRVTGRWFASITVNHHRIGLGTFYEKEEAIEARLKAEEYYFVPILGGVS